MDITIDGGSERINAENGVWKLLCCKCVKQLYNYIMQLKSVWF